MESDLNKKEIESALDQAHANAQSAFNTKDLDRYMAGFSRDLAYKQLNGKTIAWQQLRKDVADQFARMSKAESKFVRERIECKGTDIIEYVTQNATAEERILFVFKRVWRIHRRGIYTWSKINAEWVISKVEILEESVRC
jgi:hypothetical protein